MTDQQAGLDRKFAGEAITFDDVLILPDRSDVVPSQVDTRTRMSRRVPLNIPILSAAMDSVTEAGMAIALAQEGGVGIIHKNLAAEAQAREVFKVKRSENGVIIDPIVLPPDETIATARRIMAEHNISGIPIVGPNGRLVGILTRRDLRFQKGDDRRIGEVMT
ncbi:MAG: IMP dehydrogenase, partial [Planctomycetota bacterium]